MRASSRDGRSRLPKRLTRSSAQAHNQVPVREKKAGQIQRRKGEHGATSSVLTDGISVTRSIRTECRPLACTQEALPSTTVQYTVNQEGGLRRLTHQPCVRTHGTRLRGVVLQLHPRLDHPDRVGGEHHYRSRHVPSSEMVHGAQLGSVNPPSQKPLPRRKNKGCTKRSSA